MKKLSLILSLLLSVLFVFALSSCNDSPDAQAVKYQNAVRANPTPENVYNLVSASREKAKDVKGYSFSADADISFSMGGFKTSVTMSVEEKISESGLYAKINLAELGKAEITYVDGVLYMRGEADGETVKQKSTVSMEDVKKQFSEVLPDGFFANGDTDSLLFTKEALEKADVDINDNDITITVTPDDLKEINDLFGEMLNSLSGGDMTLTDASISIVIDKKGTITGGKLELSGDANMSGNNVKMDVSVDFKSDITTAPVITAPADADKYEETTLDEEEIPIPSL
ncbi:MAG: hypothetical protein ACI3XS_01660 [Eubacteriales bacterium]